MIEVLVGGGLLAIVVMAALNLLPSSTIALESSRQHLHADDLAFTRLEEARARAFGSLVPGRPEYFPKAVYDGIEYDSELQVFEVPNRNPDYLRGLRVTVSWETRGIKKRETRETWIANIQR